MKCRGDTLRKARDWDVFFVLFLRWIDFGGWSVESVLNVANVQILPVSKFNFQWDKVD